jgi:hypothetical protein
MNLDRDKFSDQLCTFRPLDRWSACGYFDRQNFNILFGTYFGEKSEYLAGTRSQNSMTVITFINQAKMLDQSRRKQDEEGETPLENYSTSKIRDKTDQCGTCQAKQ